MGIGRVKTKVLIVDDDEAIRFTVRFALEEAGFSVTEAEDGMAALDILRHSRDRMVVLLDLMMPGLDGAGVLGVVAGDRNLSNNFAYVLLTANTRTLTLAFVNLLTNLSVPILAKPFDVDGLVDVVNAAATRLNK